MPSRWILPGVFTYLHVYTSVSGLACRTVFLKGNDKEIFEARFFAPSAHQG